MSGSGDWAAGTTDHVVRSLRHDSWTRVEPAVVFAFTLFGSSPMQRFTPTLKILYVGIESLGPLALIGELPALGDAVGGVAVAAPQH